MSLRVFPPFFIVAVLFLFPTIARAQTANPPYLSQFPTVERVKAEIKGTNAMDTAARQMGAFWQLKKIIEELAGFRWHRKGQITPDEQRLHGQYQVGYHQSEALYTGQIDKPTWFKMHTNYTYAHEFRDELFEKLLTPQIRSLWEQTTGNVNQQVRASQQARNREIEAEGGPYKRQPVPSAAATTAAVGAADPSIAKAKAAKVDTTVFGMQLGDPLQLPGCPLLGRPSNCDTGATELAEGLAALLGTKGTIRPDLKIIDLATDLCPSWVSQVRIGCRAYATLHDGRLVAVAVFTNGRGVERAVTNELRAKYGPQTRTAVGSVTPDVGNAFTVNNPEWTLPGLRVAYQVVHVNEEGRVEDYREGVVRIQTESAYQRRDAERKAPVKRKL